ELIDKRGDLFPELRRLLLELVQRLSQAVSDLHVAPAELAHQLRVVIAGHGKRTARLFHAHHDLQHFRNLWTSIDEISEEHRLASFRMARFVRSVLRRDLVSELRQERVQLVETAVYVA